MTICIPPIPCRRSFPWYTVLASAFILVHRIRKNSRNCQDTCRERYGVTLPEDELLMQGKPGKISHGGLTGRTRSSLSIIFWEKRGKKKRLSKFIGGKEEERMAVTTFAAIDIGSMRSA